MRFANPVVHDENEHLSRLCILYVVVHALMPWPYSAYECSIQTAMYDSLSPPPSIVPPALPASLSAASINNTRYNITWTLTHTTPDQKASSLLINVSKPSPTIIQVNVYSLCQIISVYGTKSSNELLMAHMYSA